MSAEAEESSGGAGQRRDATMSRLVVLAMLSCATMADAQTSAVSQLNAMPSARRNMLLRRLITDGGEQCDWVDSSRYLGTRRGTATFKFHCRNSGSWIMTADANNATHYVSCAALAKVGIKTCP